MTVDDLIIPATRYYMGRMTIGVITHCQALVNAWPTLSDEVRAIIKRDLEEAFERDDAMRADERCSPSYYPLGQDVDRLAWESVRCMWLAYEANEPGPSSLNEVWRNAKVLKPDL